MKSAVWFGEFGRLLLFAAALLPSALSAQIIFIDPETFQAASHATAVSSPSLQISAAVLRFIPKDAKAQLKVNLAEASSLSAVLTQLGKNGQVDILYFGSRATRAGTDETAHFSSVENRSAFWHNNDSTGSTNRQFGLTLSIGGNVVSNGLAHLHWTGHVSWSPQFLNTWAGDKYLMFGMRLAKFVPGMSYTVDEEEQDEDAGEGINLRKVFRSKKKREEEKKAKAAAEPPISFSFIEAEGRSVEISGKQLVKPGELIVLSRPSEEGKKENESIYLVLQPEW